MTRPLDIVIPFYRNSALAENLCSSLHAIQSELVQADCRVAAINDSPDDSRLAAVLAASGFEVTANPRNLGFVQSANAGLRRAHECGHDALLLNSDTIVFPGALAEMRRVAALDPMIGFVNPRSNNAALCSLPHQEEFAALPAGQAYANFQRLSSYLPQFQYVPTAVGFCLLVKWEVLEEFGLLDEAYGAGYNEENDLVMRANRAGYRAALANRAFVYHAGGASFRDRKRGLEDKNAELLSQRYPEYLLGVVRYGESARNQGERMLPALIPDRHGRLDLVFDFSSFGPYYAGTFEAGIQILERASRQWRDRFCVHAFVPGEARRFHNLDRIRDVVWLEPDTTRTFAAALRFAQPFRVEHMARLSRLAVVNAYAMLDPIALDCMYLDECGLQNIWADVFAYADGVVYISDFVRDQFHLRFRRRTGLREMVSYLSLDLADYARPGAAPGGNQILVMGNAFAHKHVEPTVKALRAAFPDETIVALGLERCSVPGIQCFPSGQLSPGQITDLFQSARLVIFPSLYEGFGFPILEALARKRPVMARDLATTRAICDHLAAHENLHLYSSTSDLIKTLRAGFPTWADTGRLRREYPENNWDAVVNHLGQFMHDLVAGISFEDGLLPRLAHFRELEPPASADIPPASLSENLAELSVLRRMLRHRDQQIHELKTSLSWKVTAPLRTVYEWLLRPERR